MGLYGDTDALIARARDPRRAGLLAELVAWCERHAAEEPLPSPAAAFVDGSSELYLEEVQAAVFNYLLAARATGREDLAQRGRVWAGALAALPPDLRRPGNYPLGSACLGLAHALDLGRPLLSPAERTEVRQTLERLVAGLAAAMHDPQWAWWTGHHLHHDHWIPVAGCGVGALALRDGATAAEAERHLGVARQARDELCRALDLAGNDGAWHEGPADWVYAVFPLLCFADAWRAASGESLYDHPWLRATGEFRLACHLPDGRYLTWGDSFPSGRYNTMGSASGHVLARLAAEYRVPTWQWLGDRDADRDLAGDLPEVFRAPFGWLDKPVYRRAAAQCVGWRLLWRDASLPAEPPAEMPPLKVFPSAGVAVARAGTGARQAVLCFTCGALAGEAARSAAARGEAVRGYSHAHAQAGAFTLDWDGAWLPPADYGRRGDLFHSLLLVSGARQAYDPTHGGRIVGTQCEGDVRVLLGDLADAYAPGPVCSHRRTVVWLAPALCLVGDLLELEATDPGMAVTQRFLVARGDDEVAVHVEPGPRAVARRPAGALHVVPLAPGSAGVATGALHGRSGRPLAQHVDVAWTTEVRRRQWYVSLLAIGARGESPFWPLAARGAAAARCLTGDTERTLVLVTDPAAARWEVRPARADAQVVAGLPPGSRWRLEAELQPRPPAPGAPPERPPQDDHALVVRLMPDGPLTAGPAGALVATPTRAPAAG